MERKENGAFLDVVKLGKTYHPTTQLPNYPTTQLPNYPTTQLPNSYSSYIQMYAASLDTLATKLGFRVDKSKLPKQMSKSSLIGLRSDGVIDQIAYFSRRLMESQTTVNDKGEREWPYAMGGALAAGAKELVLRSDKKPHAHQLQIIDEVIDEGKGVAYSCTLQSPCASGKTLLLLLIIAALSKKTSTRALIVVNNNVAAEQFVCTITSFFNLERDDILLLDSENLDMRDLHDPVHTIFIATYQILSQKRRSKDSAIFFSLLFALPLFQIVGFDEAHCAPAQSYGEVAKKIKSPLLIAMSATLTRRDDRMADLKRCLGEKAIVVDRCELVDKGLLPSIERVDVVIDDAAKDSGTLNIRKIEVFLSFLKKSVQNGKGILVFFDTLAALAAIHTLLSDVLSTFLPEPTATGSPLLSPLFGETSREERMDIIASFRHRADAGLPVVLCLSRVGDTAFDIPADELYQITVCNGSSITEAQRLGRISRGGKGKNVSYSFISSGTSEEAHASIRGAEMKKDGYFTRTILSSQLTPPFDFGEEIKPTRIAEASRAADPGRDKASSSGDCDGEKASVGGEEVEEVEEVEAAASASSGKKTDEKKKQQRKVFHGPLAKKLKASESAK